jgi:hypothetical protein
LLRATQLPSRYAQLPKNRETDVGQDRPWPQCASKPSLQGKRFVPESGYTGSMNSYRHRSPGVVT